MVDINYESIWWSHIYDQMMKKDLKNLLDNHLHFYRSSLRGITGPVLECGCGTGLILLPLLADGLDMYGFDISKAMLDTLKRKAEADGFENITRRISVQDLESFRYEQVFDAITIPSNTFSMLTTQDAQIRALKNIHAHLIPKGKLFLDLHLVGVRELAEGDIETVGNWHIWTHPETGHPIRQRMDGWVDFNHQLVLDRCFIEYENQREEFPMNARWIFKEEFQLLLRLGGFERWEAFSTPERETLEISLEGMHSYWIIHKK